MSATRKLCWIEEGNRDTIGCSVSKEVNEHPLRGENDVKNQLGADRTRHGADRTQHGADRTRHGADRTRHGTDRTRHGAGRTRHGADRTRHGADRTRHGADRTRHGADRTRHGTDRTRHGTDRTRHVFKFCSRMCSWYAAWCTKHSSLKTRSFVSCGRRPLCHMGRPAPGIVPGARPTGTSLSWGRGGPCHEDQWGCDPKCRCTPPHYTEPCCPRGETSSNIA